MSTTLPRNWGNQVANMTATSGMTGAQAAYYRQLMMSQLGQRATTAPMIAPKTGRRFFVGDRGRAERGNTRRIPIIDQKLAKLADRCDRRSLPDGINFYLVYGDDAIDILGNYNPIYSGRPKRLAMMMLGVLPSAARNEWNLTGCGLAYPVPALIGVRSARMRLSAAGLALLDHWKEKYPKFADFMKPYDSDSARETIISNCYDLAMGHRPAVWADIDKLNVIYGPKAEIRANAKAELERVRQMKEVIAMQMKYNQANYFNNALVGPPLIDRYNIATGGPLGAADGSSYQENPEHRGLFQRLLKGYF